MVSVDIDSLFITALLKKQYKFVPMNVLKTTALIMDSKKMNLKNL